MSARSNLVVLARASSLSRRVRVVYRDVAGTETKREVDVLGLSYQDGEWYALVHCHLRRATRMLRLDRIREAHSLARRARARPPPSFDAGFFASVGYLEPGARVAHLASIRLERPLIGTAAALFPSAVSERKEGSIVCHVRASRPAILAALVASLGDGASLVDSDRPAPAAKGHSSRA